MKVETPKNNSQAGFVNMVLAIALIGVVVGILMLTIDLNQMETGASINQSAIDATTTATAEWILKGKLDKIGKPGYEDGKWQKWKPTDDEIRDFALTAFKNSLYADQSSVKPNDDSDIGVEYNDDLGQVTISSCVGLGKTALGGMREGNSEGRVCNESTAGFTVSKEVSNAEIGFALDYTTSMLDENRIGKLHNAVKTILDKYFRDAEDKNLFASIVPFTIGFSLAPYHTDLVAGADEGDNADNFIYKAASFPPDLSIDGTRFEKFPSIQQVIDDQSNEVAGCGKGNVNYSNTYQYCYDSCIAESTTCIEECGETCKTDNYQTCKYTCSEKWVGNTKVYSNCSQTCTLNPNPVWTCEKTDPACVVGQCTTVSNDCEKKCERQTASTPQYYTGWQYPRTRKEVVRNSYQYIAMDDAPERAVQPLTNDYYVLTKYNELFANAPGEIDSSRNAPFGSNPIAGNCDHMGTSGLPGLVGAWLTVAEGWKGKWNKQSLLEKSMSKTMDRSNMPAPSSRVHKYVIFITDGEDNGSRCQDMILADPSDKTSGGVNSCNYGQVFGIDYTKENVPDYDDKYKRVCDKMRQEGIQIYTILYGNVNVQSYHKACYDNKKEDEDKYIMKNVSPDQVELKLKDIFERIAAEASEVKIIK